MTKKTFFISREKEEIKGLHAIPIETVKGLVERIDGLDPFNDAIIIKTHIIPKKFVSPSLTGAESSRKCYKHGELIALPQPHTLAQTLENVQIPLYLRSEAFSRLKKMKEGEINYIGYSWRPVFGRNRTKRVVPFVNLAEGAKIFSYAENFSKYVQKNAQGEKAEFSFCQCLILP